MVKTSKLESKLSHAGWYTSCVTLLTRSSMLCSRMLKWHILVPMKVHHTVQSDGQTICLRESRYSNYLGGIDKQCYSKGFQVHYKAGRIKVTSWRENCNTQNSFLPFSVFWAITQLLSIFCPFFPVMFSLYTFLCSLWAKCGTSPNMAQAGNNQTSYVLPNLDLLSFDTPFSARKKVSNTVSKNLEAGVNFNLFSSRNYHLDGVLAIELSLNQIESWHFSLPLVLQEDKVSWSNMYPHALVLGEAAWLHRQDCLKSWTPPKI